MHPNAMKEPNSKNVHTPPFIPYRSHTAEIGGKIGTLHETMKYQLNQNDRMQMWLDSST